MARGAEPRRRFTVGGDGGARGDEAGQGDCPWCHIDAGRLEIGGNAARQHQSADRDFALRQGLGGKPEPLEDHLGPKIGLAQEPFAAGDGSGQNEARDVGSKMRHPLGDQRARTKAEDDHLPAIGRALQAVASRDRRIRPGLQILAAGEIQRIDGARIVEPEDRETFGGQRVGEAAEKFPGAEFVETPAAAQDDPGPALACRVREGQVSGATGKRHR